MRQPLDGTPWPGPFYVYRNLIVSTPEIQPMADALQSYRVFKIGVAGRNWEKPHMGGVKIEQLAAKVSKRFVVVPDPGFLDGKQRCRCNGSLFSERRRYADASARPPPTTRV